MLFQKKKDFDSWGFANDDDIFGDLGNDVYGGFGMKGNYIESCQVIENDEGSEVIVNWSDKKVTRHKPGDKNVPDEVVHIAPRVFSKRHAIMKEGNIIV